MRTIVLTGASDGIGAAAAAQLASDDTRLILVGRSPEKTRRVAEALGAEHLVADYARLDEVHALAAALLDRTERIDVLANNAGGLFDGPVRTDDGFERTFQINHLAPVLLTRLLLERLLAGRAAVIGTASIGARLFGRPRLDDLQTWRGFTPTRAYGNAKFANILFAKGLHAHFHERGLNAVAFHPGNVASNFAADTRTPLHFVYHTALRGVFIPVERGGANLAHFVAGTPGRDWQSGEYYLEPNRLGRSKRAADDSAYVQRHWELTARLLGLHW